DLTTISSSSAPSPPSPLTRFPYTTLFRSYPIPNGDAADFAGAFYSALAEGLPMDEAVAVARQQLARPTGRESCWRATATASSIGDRKSTRLNSSHDQISYAVFCLKKKNII